MSTFRLAVKEPSVEEKAYLENSINHFNIHLTDIPFNGEIAVLAYDAQDRIIGGTNGFQWGDAFTIEFLWLEEQWRGQDIGTQLMHTMEQHAAQHGCAQVYLDTYSFQAIDFYRKLDYEVVGKLENFPTPYTHYFLKKDLSVD